MRTTGTSHSRYPDQRAPYHYHSRGQYPDCRDQRRGKPKGTAKPTAQGCPYRGDTKGQAASRRGDPAQELRLPNLTEDDSDDTGADKLECGNDPLEVPVDLYPSWSPESHDLAFERTLVSGTRDRETILMRIPFRIGTPEELVSITRGEPMTVAGSMIWQEDGTILLSI